MTTTNNTYYVYITYCGGKKQIDISSTCFV